MPWNRSKRLETLCPAKSSIRPRRLPWISTEDPWRSLKWTETLWNLTENYLETNENLPYCSTEKPGNLPLTPRNATKRYEPFLIAWDLYKLRLHSFRIALKLFRWNTLWNPRKLPKTTEQSLNALKLPPPKLDSKSLKFPGGLLKTHAIPWDPLKCVEKPGNDFKRFETPPPLASVNFPKILLSRHESPEIPWSSLEPLKPPEICWNY